MKRLSRLYLLLIPLFLLATWVTAQAAEGRAPSEIITITTTDPAANPGDGQCSLIEAIDNANSDSDTSAGDCPAGYGADEIVLAAAAVYTLTGAHNNLNGDNGLPAIVSPIIISGQGSAIQRDTGAPAFRILYVGSGGELTLNDLTVRHGLSSAGFSGGGIRNQDGTLTLNSSAVRDNEAVNAGGGGIYSRAEGADATTTIQHSAVLSNTAGASGGGLMIVAGSNLTGALIISDSQVNFNQAEEDSGGIRSTRISGASNYTIQLDIVRSEVSHNSTPNVLGFVGGGGMGVNYSEVLIQDSLVSHNRVDNGSAHGGGILNISSDITIMRSTISDNVAAATGGPYQLGGGAIATTDGTVNIINSTIGGNSVTGDTFGGGLLVANFFGTAPSIVNVINSTLAGNSADNSAGAVKTFDIAGGQPVEVNFINTIVAGNQAPIGGNCVADAGTTISSQGFNLEDLDTCNFAQPEDQVNTDPLLGPLQDNGGPTPTYALLAGSPAVDAGDGTTCAAMPVAGMDQRGVSRPQGSGCDVGAYEWRDVPTDVSLSSFAGAGGGGPAWTLVVGALLLLAAAGLHGKVRRRSLFSHD